MRIHRSARVLVLTVTMAMTAGFLAPMTASADVGSPTVFYSCYNSETNSTYDVTKLSRCAWGVITIYESRDDSTHGKIQVRNGEAYAGSLTLATFLKKIVSTVASAAAKKLWVAAKAWFNSDEGDNLPEELPIG
jgi:hypothetical protein